MSTAPTKTPHPSLAEIREFEVGNSESIRNAFFRLDDARAEANAELGRIEQARPATLLTASISDIDKADERARRLRIFIEQLDLLEPELKTAFVSAKMAEQDAEFSEKLAMLKETISTWNEEARAIYPKIAAQLLPLFNRGLAIQLECAALRELPTFRRASAWSRPDDPMAQMLVGLMKARLPGLDPGDKPLWGS